MNKYLLNRPFPRFSLIFKSLSFFENPRKNLMFFKNGREALVYGLKCSGITKNSIVLAPAFICNSFTEFIISSGYQIRYVDINEDMTLDLAKIEKIFKADDIKALIFIYYFGLSFKINSLLKICKKYNVTLIEDCCHGFQTKINNQLVGTFGDFSIYSFRKVLPCSDGGALRLNNMKQSKYIYTFNFSLKNDLFYLITRIVELLARNILLINIYSKRFILIKTYIRGISRRNKLKNKQKLIFPKKRCSFLLSIFLNNKKYLSESLATRNKNFNYLLEETKLIGLKPFIKKIESNTSPQFFIIEDLHGGLHEWLKANGIGAIQWPGPEFPKEILALPMLYINANKLNKNLVMLPIHQDIEINSYKKLIALLRKWAKNNNN